jgi:site-specific recombinase XerD
MTWSGTAAGSEPEGEAKDKNDYYFRPFKRKVSRAYDTELSYIPKLHKFMEFWGIPQGQYAKLIEGRKKEEIEKVVINFIYHLAATGHPRSTQNAYLSPIMTFYRVNDIVLNRDNITSHMSNDDSIVEGQDADYGTMPYSHEQIAQLLTVAKPREKVMILLMCSSGMRVGGLSSWANKEKTKGKYLKVGDLIPVDEHDVYQIEVYAYSKSDRYFTFCTPECRYWIDEYVYRYRRDVCHEEITAKSPLLRQAFDLILGE